MPIIAIPLIVATILMVIVAAKLIIVLVEVDAWNVFVTAEEIGGKVFLAVAEGTVAIMMNSVAEMQVLLVVNVANKVVNALKLVKTPGNVAEKESILYQI